MTTLNLRLTSKSTSPSSRYSKRTTLARYMSIRLTVTYLGSSKSRLIARTQTNPARCNSLSRRGEQATKASELDSAALYINRRVTFLEEARTTGYRMPTALARRQHQRRTTRLISTARRRARSKRKEPMQELLIILSLMEASMASELGRMPTSEEASII